MAAERGGPPGRGRRARNLTPRPPSEMPEVGRPKKPTSFPEIMGYLLMGAGALLLYLYGDNDERGGEGRR